MSWNITNIFSQWQKPTLIRPKDVKKVELTREQKWQQYRERQFTDLFVDFYKSQGRWEGHE